jgi:glycosyltransferase involved in cell wall biosynthesis
MYGAETMVANLALETNQLGGEATVGIFDNAHRPKNDASERFAGNGIKTHLIACKGRADRQTVRTIRELIQSNQIQVLHSHGYKADIYGYFAARPLDMPKIATRHNNVGAQNTPALRLYEFLDMRLLRRFNAIAAVSDSIANELRHSGIAPQKIGVIHNGIDLSAFASATPTLLQEIGANGRLVVGTAGRLIPAKGMEYFLRAAKEVLAEFPNVLFVLVGEGLHRSALEQLVASLGIKENVIFTGQRTDMPNVHASFDIFVLPSL